MKPNRLFTLLLLTLSLSAQAAIVDTVETYSPSMDKKINAIVVTPDGYASADKLPVVYLLHGWGGNYTEWTSRSKGIENLADQYNVLIVCPDGGRNSWYLDSPVDKAVRYETYVSTELVAWVDGHYKTITNRNGRAITGLSMGGHGALYLAFRHQDVYGAAGSMSGGVDIRPFPNNWNLSERLGPYNEMPDNWEKNTVINLLHLVNPRSLALIIDCGTDDFFFRVNQDLHEKMAYMNIPHDYITRPGKHDWSYWGNAVGYQFLFFSNYFREF